MASAPPPPEDLPHLTGLRVIIVFKSLEEGIDAVTDSIIDAYESFKVLSGSKDGSTSSG
jgi:hypothetical protein